MINKVVGDIGGAMAGIGSGASIMISGFGNAGIPSNLVRALGAMHLSGLTLIMNAIRRIHECDPSLFLERRVDHVITPAFRGPRAAPADFALLRAQKADRYGNLYFRGTQANFGTSMATAAAITIVEVEEIFETGLRPENIHLPGIYVQRVLRAPRLDPAS